MVHKLERNDFSGFELQPSVRLAWTPDAKQTIWAAVSIAVRSPSRFDIDIIINGIRIGSEGFDSEKMMAYEIGYRILPADMLSVSITAFYNQYKDVRSLNIPNPTTLLFSNDQEAKTWGFELSVNYQLTDWWRLRSGYTYLDKDFTTLNVNVVAGSDGLEGIDPHNQFMFQSSMDLPENIQLDILGHYVDVLPTSMITVTPSTPAYFTFDTNLAWRFMNWELSVTGQNLLDNRHAEFGILEIPRSVYGKISFSM